MTLEELVARYDKRESGFLTDLFSRDLPGGREYELTRILVYYDQPTNSYFVLPTGFRCNSYSATCGPLGSWIIRGIDRRPAFLHDYLYATGTVRRAEADRIFNEAMASCDINWFKRRTMFRIVRLAGDFFFYDEDDKEVT
jgi:hypothetical protein